MSEIEEFILRLKTYNYKDCEELLKGYAKLIRADAIDEVITFFHEFDNEYDDAYVIGKLLKKLEQLKSQS